MLRVPISAAGGDAGEAHIARALELILCTLMGAAVLIFIGGSFSLPHFLGRWLLVLTAVYVLCLPALLLNRRGYTRLASLLLLLGLWAIDTGLAITAGGMAAMATVFYLIIVFVAGLLLGARAGLVTAVLCILTTLSLVILEFTGHLAGTVLPYSPLSRWISLSIFIVIMMSLQFLSARTITNALLQTRRELEDRKRAEERVMLLQTITMDVGGAPDLPAALEVVLRRVCEKTGWELGQAWIPREDGSLLDCCPAWFATTPKLAEFRSLSLETTMLEGVGLPGRVWALRQPLWLRDVTLDREFPRAEVARKCGLKAALGVPILSGDEVIAVLEFFLREPRDEDERLVSVIVAVAAQIDLVIERKRAEEELRQVSERLQLATRAANIGIWDWDVAHDELVWDDAMYRLYGIRKEDFSGAFHAWEKSLAPEDFERALVEVQAALRGEREFVHEFRIVWPDGSVHFTKAASQTFRDDEGRPLRMVGVNYDLTEVKQAEMALKTSQDSLRALSAKAHSAREEEGRRIAREIHDELGSALTGLKWDLEKIDQTLGLSHSDWNKSEVHGQIGTMTGLIEATINTVRRISSDLRPSILDDLGLVAAIEWQAQQFQERTGIEYCCDVNLDQVDLNRENATAVFRNFQEILTNVLRHSGATRIFVELGTRNGFVELKVRDNGRGISESEKGNTRSLGLLGMKERALLVGGDVNISGTDGSGTTVIVRVPLDAQMSHSQSVGPI